MLHTIVLQCAGEGQALSLFSPVPVDESRK